MTPRKKATELFNKYESTIILNSWCDENTTEDEINSLIKRCALIAVDELIYETQFEVPNIRQKYWINVKQELETYETRR
jgi:hypothetical protein